MNQSTSKPNTVESLIEYFNAWSNKPLSEAQSFCKELGLRNADIFTAYHHGKIGKLIYEKANGLFMSTLKELLR